MVYLPTSGWFLNISKANVGKYSIHGAYGYHTILQICKKSASFWGLPKTEPPRSYTKTVMYLQKEGCNDYLTNRKKASKKTQHRELFRKTSASPTSTCRTERSACFSRYDLCTTAMDQGGSMVSVVSRIGHPSHGNSMTWWPPDQPPRQVLRPTLDHSPKNPNIDYIPTSGVTKKHNQKITRHTKRVRP